MKIRRVQLGDEAHWTEAVAALVPQSAGRIASISDLGDPRCYLLLPCLDARPIGLLSAYRFPDVVAGGHFVYLYDLVVEEGHRRQGVGTVLVRALVAQCRADSVGRIWAGTGLDNGAARRVFEATGAVLEGESDAEYTGALDGPHC